MNPASMSANPGSSLSDFSLSYAQTNKHTDMVHGHMEGDRRERHPEMQENRIPGPSTRRNSVSQTCCCEQKNVNARWKAKRRVMRPFYICRRRVSVSARLFVAKLWSNRHIYANSDREGTMKGSLRKTRLYTSLCSFLPIKCIIGRRFAVGCLQGAPDEKLSWR